MPILPVPRVVPDTDILADEFNRLIDAVQDLTAGHDHTGSVYHGKPVDHVNLLSKGAHLHTEIDSHMAANRNGDGSPAVNEMHGLNGNFRIAGARNAADASKQIVFEVGSMPNDPPGWSPYYSWRVKDCTTSISQLLGVVLTGNGSNHWYFASLQGGSVFRAWTPSVQEDPCGCFYLAWGYCT